MTEYWLGVFKRNWGIILGAIYFGLFFTYNIQSIPYLDANFDFIKSINFYDGGLTRLIEKYGSTMHPPGKDVLLYPLYAIFGKSVFAFHLLSFPFALLALFFGKKVTQKLTNDLFSANASALLIGTFPLFISVGTQGLNDFFVACLAPFFVYLFLEKKYIYFAVVIALSFFIKETSLAFLPGFALYAILFSRKNKKELLNLFLSFLIPVFAVLFWSFYLKKSGSEAWNHYIFDSSNTNPFLISVKKILSLDFKNTYFIENLKHLLFLNFNWVYWLFIIISIKVKRSRERLGKNGIVLLTTCCLSYVVLVLNFPTYTIPRYILPVFVLVIILSVSLFASSAYKYLVLLALLFINVFAGFRSMDPISRYIWNDPLTFGRFWIFNETLYNLNDKVSGNDRLTYNLQYIFIIKERTRVLRSISEDTTLIYSPDCLWLFRSPKEDLYTLQHVISKNVEKLPECERRI